MPKLCQTCAHGEMGLQIVLQAIEVIAALFLAILAQNVKAYTYMLLRNLFKSSGSRNINRQGFNPLILNMKATCTPRELLGTSSQIGARSWGIRRAVLVKLRCTADFQVGTVAGYLKDR